MVTYGPHNRALGTHNRALERGLPFEVNQPTIAFKRAQKDHSNNGILLQKSHYRPRYKVCNNDQYGPRYGVCNCHYGP